MSRFSYGFTLFKEFMQFAREHKAYWIVPMILVLGGVVVLVAMGQFAAPFIYTLF